MTLLAINIIISIIGPYFRPTIIMTKTSKKNQDQLGYIPNK